MELTKLVERPPFANYDLVVYFGGGLFCIPFVNRYIMQPTKLQWPNFEIGIDGPAVQLIITALASLFSIYIIGHLIAYLSSQLIEKALNRMLGKVSTAIIISSLASAEGRDFALRSVISDNIISLRSNVFRIANLTRLAFHLPALLLYYLSFKLGVFGYFDTRISNNVMNVARRKMISLDIDGLRITRKTKWFKPLEYWVINNNPQATLRMYNYLVIAGLFRSLSFIFLASCWFVFYAIVHLLIYQDNIYASYFARRDDISLLLEFAVLITLYLFSLFSFVKFQRRYAEEAIFAFSLSGKS